LNASPQAAHPIEEFSLVLGGPLYQACRRAHLLQPPIGLMQRRIAAGIVIAWLPLLLLTVAGGQALGGAQLPFLYDIDTQVRLLPVVALLIGAEALLHHRLRMTVRQFPEHGIVTAQHCAAFDALAAATVRWRDSALAETALLACSIAFGSRSWGHDLAQQAGSWAMDHSGLSAAGWWYALVSLNLLRFLLFRWYYRVAIWYVFMWRVSRLPLHLNPLHPDRCGGLGFLGIGLRAFVPLLLAHTMIISGAIAGRILNQGAQLPAYQMEIVGSVVCLLALTLLPLTFFIMPLVRARLQGWAEYGALAMQYTDEFRRKWMTGEQPGDEPLIGSGDIQSLADLANAHEVLAQMRVVPVSRSGVVRLAIAIALPFVPLAFTMFPLDELIGRLLGKLL
jgi:hypothetical protein